MYRLPVLLLFAILLIKTSSCEREEPSVPLHPVYPVSYRYAAVDTLSGEDASYDFCTQLEFKQLVSGATLGATGLSSATGGINFSSFPGRVQAVATRLISMGNEPGNLNAANLYPNVESAIRESDSIRSYVLIEL
jgi:hypothetical protein